MLPYFSSDDWRGGWECIDSSSGFWYRLYKGFVCFCMVFADGIWSSMWGWASIIGKCPFSNPSPSAFRNACHVHTHDARAASNGECRVVDAYRSITCCMHVIVSQCTAFEYILLVPLHMSAISETTIFRRYPSICFWHGKYLLFVANHIDTSFYAQQQIFIQNERTAIFYHFRRSDINDNNIFSFVFLFIFGLPIFWSGPGKISMHTHSTHNQIQCVPTADCTRSKNHSHPPPCIIHTICFRNCSIDFYCDRRATAIAFPLSCY